MALFKFWSSKTVRSYMFCSSFGRPKQCIHICFFLSFNIRHSYVAFTKKKTHQLKSGKRGSGFSVSQRLELGSNIQVISRLIEFLEVRIVFHSNFSISRNYLGISYLLGLLVLCNLLCCWHCLVVEELTEKSAEIGREV